jgi:uncharacterized protein
MNRLANEKSPYLLQHKNNPVDWYPWGEEAFEKAKKEDKPIFLSIGYATCHWCHVMEHESFEDETVAKLMNDAFVNIKVDREERPDIDHTYMTICQMLTGQGGWPLTIVMTPEKEPFYAATYLPRHSRPQRIGMLDFVPGIQKAWETDRGKVLETTEQIKAGFSKTLNLAKGTEALPPSIVESARNSLSERFDAAEGGFGTAPKFPSPHNLLFLIQHHRKTGNKKDIEMIGLTLKKMRLGGLWDHVGFGFHRYSTDHRWLLPHFEKMLYDQAILLFSYAEGWQLTQQPLFRQTAYEIVEYLDECLTSPEGAFYSAEDADSEGEEGKFYVWKPDEIKSILNDEEAGLFLNLYNFDDDGNFHDEATRQKTGQNIPHLSHSVAEAAKKENHDPKVLESAVSIMLSTLKKEREKRERPLLDDKILTDWNGLAIAALARAGIILNEPSMIERAEKAWAVIEKHCCVNEKLLHRLKDGDAEIDGMADDYVFIIWGLIELYNATFNPRYLEKAIQLQDRFNRDFFDPEFGGYFFTATDGEELLGRQKEIYDGAMPSSNSVAAHNGIRLSKLTADPGFEDKAESVFKVFSEQIADAPAGYTHAIHAFDVHQTESAEVVITAEKWNRKVDEAIRLCHEKLPPGSVILVKTNKWRDRLNKIAPFVKNYPVHEQLSVYVCRNFECKTPVFSTEELKTILSN